MPHPLVSIIVPIYKVEPYLRRCIDSIVNQTYTNLEIILVDDGSPDSCPQICDEYAAKDNRFVVIHKENGGLSDARNAGLDICKGDYIYFLDGDDFLGKEVIACLHHHITKKDNTAIAIGYFTSFHNDQYSTYRKDWIFHECRYIKSTDFIDSMLMEKSNFAATAKLYRRELFKSLRFKKNKKNEDTIFIADLAPIIEAHSYLCIDIPNYSYYYTQHSQSISHNQSDPLERHIINNYRTILKQYKDRPSLVKFLKKREFDLSIDLQRKLLKNGEIDAYIENIKFIKTIPFSHAIKRKSVRFLLFFAATKYTPRLLIKLNKK